MMRVIWFSLDTAGPPDLLRALAVAMRSILAKYEHSHVAPDSIREVSPAGTIICDDPDGPVIPPGDDRDRMRRLFLLYQIYRVISGEETGWVDLPADVAAEIVGESQGRRWVVSSGPGVRSGHIGFHCADGLGSGVGIPSGRVRAAVDAVARRLLRSSPAAVKWPEIRGEYLTDVTFGGGSVKSFTSASLGSGIDWPGPEILHACDRARLFLASLDYLSVSDARQASELRHRLREEIGRYVLRDAVHFLSGIHPARPGQAAVMADLMRIAGPREKTRP